MKRALYLVVGVILVAFSTGARAQETPTPPEATIAAYATQVSELNEQIDKLQTSVAKRDAKIDEQRARIAELKEEVETLEGQLPPTPTPTPELSGKDAYPYVTNAQELFTRPHNHLGTKVSFCGRVGYIEVARPGYVFTPGDSVSTSWATVAQVFLDGVDVQFMVGFDGDTSGIYEDSYVCVWGTLVDTMSGTNSFGGTIVNPLFDAEYFELA